ncbi:MAG: hybrid sensor histidine kinase/response regulator [Deltaproteobacteria bacterium]|nr:hybrid sensor histidine kinase/response regulator [Deltaproteobacteria bacterium]
MSFVIAAEANLALASMAAEILSQAGFESRGADSLTEVLAICQERRIDLVLTSFFLASGDGLGLISALKKQSPETAVVLSTGLGSEELVRQALQTGAFDYVIKGPDYFRNLPQLAASVIDRFNKARAASETELQRSRLRAQMELSGWLDHNFKNILSAVMGSLALINFNNPAQSTEKRQEYLTDSLDSLRSAVRLLDSLTAMTNVVSGGQEEERQSLVVASLVDEAWENVRQAAGNTGLAGLSKVLEAVIFQNNTRWLPPQQGVYRDLLTILEALLMNSLEALVQVPDPHLLVTVFKEDSCLKFVVRDNGRGMDEKVQRHAFEPLFSTKGQVGVGLSLTMVRALVDRHLGEIHLQSSPGQGTVIDFTYYVGS